MAITDFPLNLLPKTGLIIGSDRIANSSGGIYEHIYAATGKPTASVVLAGLSEIQAAVESARRALPGWRSMPADRRRDLILQLCHLITRNAKELAGLQTVENAIPQQFAAAFPKAAADYLAYNAGWTDKIGGSVVATWPGQAFDYTRDEPYGVIAILIPWNAPLPALGQLLGPALAAGNTVILKPPELAPFTSLRIGELILEAGFPPGVVNVVPADPEGSSALVCNPGIDKIHFTGSSETARKVLAAALENVTPVALELGGKSALLVFSDADLLAAAQQALSAAVVLSGQGCMHNTRVLAEKPVYDRLLRLVVGMLKRVHIGDPFSERTVVGPVISAAACERILGVINVSRQLSCGRLMTGGERLGGELADGYFISPAIFADVDNASALAQNEIFGPVVSFMSFSTEEEAIELANNTRYGLAAYVYTHDLRRAHRLGEQLIAGTVWVNGFDGIPAAAPFGGVKQSGYGRIGGKEGIKEFTRSKNVWISMNAPAQANQKE